MAAIILEGFVIRKQNYKDKDLIVTILTPDGKFSFLALGVRKIESKNRVALQLGNLIEIEVFKARLNNKLSKLKKAHNIKEFPFQVSDIASVMMVILKIINKINQPNYFFYKALDQAFDYFGTEYNHQIKTYFKYLNLKHHGLNPIMNKCCECGSFKNILDFNWDKGGFLCSKHALKKTPLIKLKSYEALSLGIAKYIKTTSKINFNIDKEIELYAKQFLY